MRVFCVVAWVSILYSVDCCLCVNISVVHLKENVCPAVQSTEFYHRGTMTCFSGVQNLGGAVDSWGSLVNVCNLLPMLMSQ